MSETSTQLPIGERIRLASIERRKYRRLDSDEPLSPQINKAIDEKYKLTFKQLVFQDLVGVLKHYLNIKSK